MSEGSVTLGLAIIAGIVSLGGAAITAYVAVITVRLRGEVAETKAIVTTIPAHVTTEAKATRAALVTNVAAAERLARDSSPDDAAPGAVHTHQRRAAPGEQ